MVGTKERSLFRLTVDRPSYIICVGVRETSFTPFFVAWWNPGERKGSQILWYFIREGEFGCLIAMRGVRENSMCRTSAGAVPAWYLLRQISCAGPEPAD